MQADQQYQPISNRLIRHNFSSKQGPNTPAECLKNHAIVRALTAQAIRGSHPNRMTAIPKHGGSRIKTVTQNQIERFSAAIDLQLKIAAGITDTIAIANLDQQRSITEQMIKRIVLSWWKPAEAQ